MAISTNSVALVGLNSANVRFDNSKDSDRVFDVSANVDIASKSVNSFNGDVYKDGVYAANFTCYNASENANSLSINYQNLEVTQQCAVLDAVQEFIRATREFVAENAAVELFG